MMSQCGSAILSRPGWLTPLVGALAQIVTVGATAGEKPLWELGAGVSVLQFPAYRGSDESRLFVLPVPYVVYRGEFLKADREGIRGTFFDSDRVELSLSLSASPPVSSDKVDVREGMPDLEPTVEVGPSLDVRLWRSSDERLRLRTRLPLRAGFTVENSPESTGWQFTPQLNLDWRDPAGMNGWTLGVVAGPVFGDRRQHRYFYGVEGAQATATRPAYDVRGGYAGTQVLAALWKRFPGWWLGGFVRYDSLAGAVFDDSPLVKSRDYFAAGVAVTWVLGESSQRVEADD
ncbi:MipA/OmpV family protein [Aromatoleum diolicum]|uniref:MipA/OmpV family protein n=1 Tax=Aromatoleum diolicum TaxID=75796 RepID=A0ABX1QCE3_9RHOO|nr:MipA/OmpV family protein [Aromatoleum diolicum]NMG76071.1 MipA/OmpV family protein [Aromatoleum diolicum]